jgi:hypothetical protein
MRRMRSLLLAIAMLSATGCQTQFVGNAHIDPGTCQARCTADHLEMAGMVYMGDYSSACICEVPRSEAPAPPPPPGQPPAPGGPPGSGGASGAVALAPGSLGATAGVIMQMRANQQGAQGTWRTAPRH